MALNDLKKSLTYQILTQQTMASKENKRKYSKQQQYQAAKKTIKAMLIKQYKSKKASRGRRRGGSRTAYLIL